MYTKDGFYKALEQKLGDDAYILLAGGGTKKLADLLTAASLTADGNYTKLSVTVGGTTKTGSVTVPYASKAGQWATARTLTIGSKGKSVDGSANVSWSLDEIGVYSKTTSDGRYLQLSGGTMTGNISFSNSGTGFRGINYGTMGDNDQWRIGGAATGSNAGYMELATADDGNEPIYVRQYTGVFSSLTRTATLLDASGNTSFPGVVTASRFVSSVGTGTQPYACSSTTVNTNLNADLLDGIHANGLLTSASLGTSGNSTTISVTVGGTTKTGSVTVPYATNSDTVDGYHYNNLPYHPWFKDSSLDANSAAVGWHDVANSISNAAHSNHSSLIYVSNVGTPYQLQIPDSSVMYIYKRYYSGGWSSWSKISAGYADSAGSVAWGNVSSKPATATRWPTWDEVTSKPSTFTPSSHTHDYLPLSGGNMTTTAQILCYTKSKGSSDIYNGAIQLREATGSTTSCTDNMYDAPGITFHWGGWWVHKLNMHSNALYWDNTKISLDGHTHSYLPLAGGTMNNQAVISRAGDSVAWVNGRKTPIIKTTSYTGYNSILSMKTTNGSWDLGVYSDNKAYLTYITDTNYNSGTNNTTYQLVFPQKNGTLAVTGDIPTNNNQLTNGAGYITSSGSCAYATSAGSVAWGNVSSKPATATRWPTWAEVTGKPFNWSGQSGQPTWLWGSNDGSNYYVWNPSNFSVNSATTSTILLTNNTSQAADSCYTGAPGLRFWRYNGTSSTTGQGGGDGWILSWSWNNGSVGGQIYLDDNPSKTMCIRGCNGSDSNGSPTGGFTTWATILHSDNYTSYTVTKTGSGASGTWGINVTGSAGSVAWGNVTGKPSTYTPSSHNHDGTYLKLSGGTMSGNIIFPSDKGIIQNQASTSNYTIPIIWLKGGTSQNTYNPQIGQHNTGGDGSGSICILPYATSTSPWEGTVGLFVAKNSLKWENNTIIHSGNIGSQSVSYATSAGNADTVDSLHGSNLVRFFLSPMTSGAPADSAKSWFTGTMPSASGAIVYNVPGSEKTIIAGKSSGEYGHMLQLNYDDNYLRILRYQAGNWKSTDWEKISAGYADSAGYASSSGNSDTVDSYHANQFAFTYCSANYGASSSVTVNDLVTNGVSNASHGMIYAATDNPVGTSNWVHVWSQQWTIGTTSSWVSQIALGVQQGTGMWYRTTSGNVVGRGWTRVLDTSNYTSYTISRTGDDITGHFTVRGRIFGYNYNNQGSNAVAFMWDKPGSYYTGMGPNGVTNQIHFGPCNTDGTWVSGFSQQWDFQGNVYASNFYVSSDRTKKTNIESIASIVPIRKFNWKENGSLSYGFIAQELVELGHEELVHGTEGNMTVNYDAALSFSMAKLSNYVERLEHTVEELKDENNNLKSKIKDLYKLIVK